MHAHAWVWVLATSALAGCFGGGTGGATRCPPNLPSCTEQDCDGGACDGGDSEPGRHGNACEADSDCTGALRLVCVQGACDFAGDRAQGAKCKATGECKEGFYCAAQSSQSCERAGDAREGSRCQHTADCARSLVCAQTGLTTNCVAPGRTDLGEECVRTADCIAGLVCDQGTSAEKARCAVAAPGEDQETVTWAGLACEDEGSDATAYFHVPREAEPATDFFRLPFPNDVRRREGELDLAGFPSPQNRTGLGDFVGAYVNAIKDLDGFATNPVVYFRFSEPYDGASEATVWLFNVDPDSPEYGQSHARLLGTSQGRVTAYVCENWLNVRTGPGAPLAPGTTYAVVLTRGITPKAGDAFRRDADLAALLAESKPEDRELFAAHAAYAPLRGALAAKKLGDITIDDVLNAAVFTTQDPSDLMAKVASAVKEQPAPATTDVTVCEVDTRSPCADGVRACEVHDDFVEIHGRMRLPIFQEGAAPYRTEGGGIHLDGDGSVAAVRNEEVCFGLALPKASASARGYPLVIYGHATGDHFATGLRVLGATAAGVGAAVLSIDLPQHGARASGSEFQADELVYNFEHPQALLGNLAQGSADLLSLIDWAQQLDEPADSAFGQAVTIDASRIALFAHGQGATHASIALPYASLAGVVFAGLAGDFSEALPLARAPFDLARALPVLMADPSAAVESSACETCVGSNHPVYGLLQTYFERVDPVNFAQALALPSASPKHVFMMYGLEDNYTPEAAQKAYVIAGSLAHVEPELASIYHAGAVASPALRNVAIGDVEVTQGARQYAPAPGTDGHVVFQGPGAADWQRFLTAILQGSVPQIGE